MGMRWEDFCRLRPEEFEAVYKAWEDSEQMRYRDGWERARVVAAICVSPHIKGRTNAKKILPLPWDQAGPGAVMPSSVRGAKSGQQRGEKVRMETREEGHRNLAAMIKAVEGK